MKSLRNLWLLCGLLTLIIVIRIPLTAVNASGSTDPGLHQVFITNLRDGSFVVSWTTALASDGFVDWGTTTSLGSTASDPVTNTTTHYVTISGLYPSTTYYFQVRSGSATDNNGGAYYSSTTGPTLNIPIPGKTIWGYVFQADGVTPITNALVYIQLQDVDGVDNPGVSQWVSARTDSNGVWAFELANVRTTDAGAYYLFTSGTDKMQLAWQAGAAGSVGVQSGDEQVFLIPTSFPYQIDMSMVENTAYGVFLPLISKGP